MAVQHHTEMIFAQHSTEGSISLIQHWALCPVVEQIRLAGQQCSPLIELALLLLDLGGKPLRNRDEAAAFRFRLSRLRSRFRSAGVGGLNSRMFFGCTSNT